LAEGKTLPLGAYDALLHNRLLCKMRALGLHERLIRLVQSFLTGRKVRVRHQGATTDFSDLECGTPQGSPLSSVLYMIYMADLAKQGEGRVIIYADDCLFIRIGADLASNVSGLEIDLARADNWAYENKIAFAPEKSELIHITGKNDIPRAGNPPVFSSGVYLQPVEGPTEKSKWPGPVARLLV